MARENSEGPDLKQGTLLEVGQEYLTFLFSSKNYKLAAELCPEILNSNQKAWQEWVYKFAESNQLQEIYAFIPFKEVVLESTIYELILSRFLDTDKDLFLSMLHLWPFTVFDRKNVISSVNEAMKKSPNDSNLLESLLIL